MSENVYELCLVFPSREDAKEDILTDMLLSMGFKTLDIIVSFKQGNTCVQVYFNDRVKAQKAKRRLDLLDLAEVKIIIKILKKTDWLTVWKKDFKPFQISTNFDIVPVWDRDKYKKQDRELIYIDTTQAFGTGLHSTTRFMTQFIDRYRGKYESFLDIGTGTGILAIVAHKCGATHIRGVDISADAVKVAKKNALENKTGGIKFSAGDFFALKSKEKYDYVAANLITEDLVKHRKEILKCVKSGKYLAISGISVDNYRWLREFFDKLPLRCLKIEKAEGWVALLYQKIKK